MQDDDARLIVKGFQVPAKEPLAFASDSPGSCGLGLFLEIAR